MQAETLTRRGFYAERFETHRNMYTWQLLYTQMPVYAETFSQTSFTRKMFFHTDAFTYKQFLHTDPFTQRNSYAKKLSEKPLHRAVFTQTKIHRNFEAEELLHGAFTHGNCSTDCFLPLETFDTEKPQHKAYA